MIPPWRLAQIILPGAALHCHKGRNFHNEDAYRVYMNRETKINVRPAASVVSGSCLSLTSIIDWFLTNFWKKERLIFIVSVACLTSDKWDQSPGRFLSKWDDADCVCQGYLLRRGCLWFEVSRDIPWVWATHKEIKYRLQLCARLPEVRLLYSSTHSCWCWTANQVNERSLRNE